MLLLVLILGVTCTMLSLALVSTAEIGLRAETNADDLDRAERGAQSGVEWGAATVKAWGKLARSGTVVLDTGVEVGYSLRLLQSPELLGVGSLNGATVRLGAKMQQLERERPYAFSSFSQQTVLTQPVAIAGHAYLGGTPKPLQATSALQMAGDLDLVTGTALAAGQVVHSSGATAYGVAARTTPVWDTTSFLLDTGWTVPITRYTGNTTITGKSLSGLVIVSLSAGQRLVLDDVTIRGTLVVPWLYPPALDILGTTSIRLKGTVAIGGGTADTGNLAILAPGSSLERHSTLTSLTVAGVTYALAIDQIENASFQGMVLLRDAMNATLGRIDFVRAQDFVPIVPVGIDLYGGTRYMIAWLGRQ